MVLCRTTAPSTPTNATGEKPPTNRQPSTVMSFASYFAPGGRNTRSAVDPPTFTPRCPALMNAQLRTVTSLDPPLACTAPDCVNPALPRNVQPSTSARWHPTMSIACPPQPSTVHPRTTRSSTPESLMASRLPWGPTSDTSTP